MLKRRDYLNKPDRNGLKDRQKISKKCQEVSEDIKEFKCCK
jgi:hypothetical protein